MKIVVSGIGAVGGYYGGLMAEFCSNNSANEIYFFARENTVNTIKNKGLQLETFSKTNTIFPQKISSNAKDFGTVDLIILCTKSYDLIENLDQLHDCVDENTSFLPLLNGINIKAKYPKNDIWNGFVFLYAQKTTTNYIKEINPFNQFHFGKNIHASKKQISFQKLIENSNIRGGFFSDIRIRQWKKFTFISTLACITTYYNCTLGEVISNEKYSILYDKLMDEIIEFSNKEMRNECLNFQFNSDYKNEMIDQIAQSNPIATTSLQRDYYNNTKNELETLVGIVSKSSQEYSHYNSIYHSLSKK